MDTPTNEIFDYRNNSPIALAGHQNSLVSQNRTHQTRDYFFSGVGFRGSTGSTHRGLEPANTFRSVTGLRTPRQRPSAASAGGGHDRGAVLEARWIYLCDPTTEGTNRGCCHWRLGTFPAGSMLARPMVDRHALGWRAHCQDFHGSGQGRKTRMTRVAVTEEPGAPAGFSAALRRLQRAQKSSRGAPAYSLYINRPLGRVLAAAAYGARLTPNQVTAVSAVFTFSGLAVLALAPAEASGRTPGRRPARPRIRPGLGRRPTGPLTGGGSLGGEWLDHTVDWSRWWRSTSRCWSPSTAASTSTSRWLLVPLAFAVASSVHFFGMILVDLFRRVRSAEAPDTIEAPPAPSRVSSLLKVPTDYGVLCLAMLLLGFHGPFVGVYTVLAAAMVGYTALVLGKWRRDIAHLERGGRSRCRSP